MSHLFMDSLAPTRRILTELIHPLDQLDDFMEMYQVEILRKQATYEGFINRCAQRSDSGELLTRYVYHSQRSSETGTQHNSRLLIDLMPDQKIIVVERRPF